MLFCKRCVRRSGAYSSRSSGHTHTPDLRILLRLSFAKVKNLGYNVQYQHYADNHEDAKISEDVKNQVCCSSMAIAHICKSISVLHTPRGEELPPVLISSSPPRHKFLGRGQLFLNFIVVFTKKPDVCSQLASLRTSRSACETLFCPSTRTTRPGVLPAASADSFRIFLSWVVNTQLNHWNR